MITPSFGLTATERVLPKLALDFTTASLDPRITFTRTTSASNPATYIDSSGVVTSATNNQPRFDYDPVTLACKGLLIEEQRTNLLTYSDDLSIGWTASRLDVTTDYILGPDNTTSGNYLLCNTTSVNNMSVSKTGLTFSGSALTTSFFVKKGYDNFAQVVLYDGGSNGVRQWFNVNTGAVASSNTFGTGWAKTAATITPYANGWYRCTLSVSTTGTACGVILAPSVPADLTNGCTTGVTYGYLWGAQLEAGAFATSYIPTTTTALTRNADNATMTGTNFSDWYTSSGSFVFQGSTFNTAASRVILDATDGTTNDRIQLYASSGGIPTIYIADGGVTQAQAGATAISANTTFKAAFGFTTNSVVNYVNGAYSAQDTSATMPTLDRTTLFCRYDSTLLWNGHAKKLFFYPQRLTNSELAAFSK